MIHSRKGLEKMIVSKSEESFFHNFLTVAKSIFKETGSRNILLFGRENKLKFISGEYAGIFAYDTQRLDSEYYNFGYDAYELSVLSNDDIKLEKMSYFPCSDYYLETVEKFFNGVDIYSNCALEIKKDEECKIAKVMASTGCWLSDDALKYLSKFKNCEIYTCTEPNRENFNIHTLNDFNNEYVAAYQEMELDGGQTLLSMTLVFNVRTNPRLESYSQQKIKFNDEKIEETEEISADKDSTAEHSEESEELDSLVDDIEEDGEDDFDPMFA